MLWNFLFAGITVRLPQLRSYDDVHNRFFRRHLLGTKRREEAKTVVSLLNGVPIDDPLVEETIEELDYAINAENEGGKATWAECFSTRNKLWLRTGHGMMLQFIQQLNGQNFYCKYSQLFTTFLPT